MTGLNGDFYLDTTSYNVYKKTAGVWNVICNIKGATGVQGIQGPAGTGADYLRSTPKYTVALEGGFYHVYKDDGSLSYSTGSFETAVNDEAFAGLTGSRDWHERVHLKHDFIQDAKISVPNYTILSLDGRVELANGVNTAMVDAETTDAESIIIEGGTWNGNSVNQTTGTAGFSFGGECNRVQIRNTIIRDIWGHGIRLNGSQHRLENLTVFVKDDDTVTWETNCALRLAISDSIVSKMLLQSWAAQLFLQYASSCVIDGIYCGGSTAYNGAVDECKGQFIMNQCDNNHVSNVRCDGASAHSFYILNCNKNIFQNLIATSMASDDNTYDGWYIDDSLRNIILGLFVGQKDDYPTTFNFKHAVNEITSSDYNSYVGVQATDCDTSNYVKAANSTIIGAIPAP
jgi:hypothetical protein